jgi:hypothetical protein
LARASAAMISGATPAVLSLAKFMASIHSRVRPWHGPIRIVGRAVD